MDTMMCDHREESFTQNEKKAETRNAKQQEE